MSVQQLLLSLLLLGILVGAVFLLTEDHGASRANWYSLTKPAGAEEDVQDVLTLPTRKDIYLEDWKERERIENYVITRYPVDFDARLSIQNRQFEEQTEEWERLYDEYVAGVCRRYGIPWWQYNQILDEGLGNRWQMELVH